MKILICGDSYAVTDSDYPGLHWSEKILDFSPNFEIINLAHGGCSNALIALQLSQGLRFNPNFVIFSFTSPNRYEYDKEVSALPKSLDPMDIAEYIKNRYTTNKYEENKERNKSTLIYTTETASMNFEWLKNYFYIMYALNTVQTQNIKFCYSLGGFEYKQDYKMSLNNNFISNDLMQYQDRELLTNLWQYEKKSRPYFHVDNDQVQTLFANQCIEYING